MGEYVDFCPVHINNAFPNAFTKLRFGLIHGNKNTGDFQGRIKFGLHRTNQLQDFWNALACQEVSLYWDNAVIGSREGVDRKKLILQSAVNDDVVVVGPKNVRDHRQHLFTGAVFLTNCIILRQLHNL